MFLSKMYKQQMDLKDMLKPPSSPLGTSTQATQKAPHSMGAGVDEEAINSSQRFGEQKQLQQPSFI